MKKLTTLFLFLLLLSPSIFSQRVLLNETFETSGFTGPDSLPTDWLQFNEDGSSSPTAVWRTRDTSSEFPGANAILHSRANFFTPRSISIPWPAGDPIADDWLFTPGLNILNGDSLSFWMLFGTPADSIINANLQPYFDTMQVWVSVVQDPAGAITKLATLRSLDSNNVWQNYKYDLSSFNGQTIYIGFRYYMNTSVNGLWCNIDNVLVGNASAIGIHNISTTVPRKYDMKQNYPNPFNPITNIEFDIAKSGYTSLIVYNMAGQEVTKLVDQNLNPGTYKVDFDASKLASGTYLYRITSGDFVKTSKMILVK